MNKEVIFEFLKKFSNEYNFITCTTKENDKQLVFFDYFIDKLNFEMIKKINAFCNQNNFEFVILAENNLLKIVFIEQIYK